MSLWLLILFYCLAHMLELAFDVTVCSLIFSSKSSPEQPHLMPCGPVVVGRVWGLRLTSIFFYSIADTVELGFCIFFVLLRCLEWLTLSQTLAACVVARSLACMFLRILHHCNCLNKKCPRTSLSTWFQLVPIEFARICLAVGICSVSWMFSMVVLYSFMHDSRYSMTPSSICIICSCQCR